MAASLPPVARYGTNSLAYARFPYGLKAILSNFPANGSTPYFRCRCFYPLAYARFICCYPKNMIETRMAKLEKRERDLVAQTKVLYFYALAYARFKRKLRSLFDLLYLPK
jgi:hypothetical protein